LGQWARNHEAPWNRLDWRGLDDPGIFLPRCGETRLACFPFCRVAGMGKGEREEEEEEEVSKSRTRVLLRTRRMQSGRLGFKYVSRYIYHRSPSLL